MNADGQKKKRETIQDLATGRESLKDLFIPEGVVKVHPGGYECLDKTASPELRDELLFSIHTRIGERRISWNQLQKVRGDDQTLIFLPGNSR